MIIFIINLFLLVADHDYIHLYLILNIFLFLFQEHIHIRIMTIHIIKQENETCPATKPEKKYINRNEREFPA
jgi:hypothetical protein